VGTPTRSSAYRSPVALFCCLLGIKH